MLITDIIALIFLILTVILLIFTLISYSFPSLFCIEYTSPENVFDIFNFALGLLVPFSTILLITTSFLDSYSGANLKLIFLCFFIGFFVLNALRIFIYYYSLEAGSFKNWLRSNSKTTFFLFLLSIISLNSLRFIFSIIKSPITFSISTAINNIIIQNTTIITVIYFTFYSILLIENEITTWPLAFWLCTSVSMLSFIFSLSCSTSIIEESSEMEIMDVNEVEYVRPRRKTTVAELDTRTATLYDAIISDDFYEIENFIGQFILQNDAQGWTALHLACALNRVNIVNEFLRLLKADGFTYASPEFRTRKEGWTPLIVSMLFGQLDVARAILEKKIGASIEETDKYGHNIMRLSLERNCLEEIIGYIGNQEAVILAAGNGMTKVVRDLLATGAPLESKNEEGITPFISALQHGFPKTAKYLIEKGANITTKSKSGLRPIHYACQNNANHDIIIELFSKGISVSEPVAQTGRQPIHFAIEFGCLKIAKLLMDYNIDFDCKDFEGTTPTMLARNSKNPNMLSFVRKIGSQRLSDLIPEIPFSQHIVFPPMDIDPQTDPTYIWIDFLVSLQQNFEIDLKIDTSQARLSHRQVGQIVAALRSRSQSIQAPVLYKKYCGLDERTHDIELIVQNEKFSVQRLAYETSTKHELADKQKFHSQEPLETQIQSSFIALLTFPFWILLGFVDYLFNLNANTQNSEKGVEEPNNINDAFIILFGKHLDKSTYLNLFQTSRWKKFLLVCFVLFSSFTYIYPPLFIFVAGSLLNQKFLFFLFLIVLLVYVMLPLLILQKILWNDPNLTAIEFPQPEATTLTFRNFLAFFSVFLDLFQLCALTFITDRFHSDAQVGRSFSILLFSFDFIHSSTRWRLIFFVVIALVILWLSISSFIFYATRMSQPWILRKVPKLNLFCSILSNTLFITITTQLLSIIDCTDSVLDLTSNSSSPIRCWEGEQLFLSSIAVIFFILYVWAVNVIGTFYHTSFNIKLEVHIFTAYHASERFIKLIATVVSVLLSSDDYAYLRLFALFFAYLLLFVLALRFKPADNITLNQLKIIFGFLALWSVICSIVATSYGPKSWLPFILLTAGAALVFIIWLILWMIGRYRGEHLWGLNKQLQEEKNVTQKTTRHSSILSLPDSAVHFSEQRASILCNVPKKDYPMQSFKIDFNAVEKQEKEEKGEKGELKLKLRSPRKLLVDNMNPITFDEIDNEFSDKFNYNVHISLDIRSKGKEGYHKIRIHKRDHHRHHKKRSPAETKLEPILEESDSKADSSSFSFLDSVNSSSLSVSESDSLSFDIDR